MPFVIHHVGARFGNAPFPLPQQFASEFELILFDADDDCIEGLAERDCSEHGRDRVISACLSDRDGEGEFKITMNPPGSSLLEPSTASCDFSQLLFGIDWYAADCLAVVERRIVKTSRLDSLMAARTDIAIPDFLSLDTQGNEYEIISGGVETIESSVVGLIVEVEFVSLYADVKRFGQVSDLLQTLGFHFCGFLNLHEAYVSRQPIGFRSKGFPVYADALFLRRVERIPEERPIMAAKLALASLIFGFLDHAFAAMARVDGSMFRASPENWMTMLGVLNEASQHQPRVYLPRFPDILRPEDRKRFSEEPDIARWPAMVDLVDWLIVQEHRCGSLDVALAQLLGPADTSIERILRKYGFGKLADTIALRRRDESFKLQELIVASALSRTKTVKKC